MPTLSRSCWLAAVGLLVLAGCEKKPVEEAAAPQRPSTIPADTPPPSDVDAASPVPAAAPTQVTTDRTEPPSVAKRTRFPEGWFFRDPSDRTVNRRPIISDTLENSPPPPLTVEDWIGEPQDLAALAAAGKIVVVEFWGAELQTTIKAVNPCKKLVEDYSSRGVVLIGVHHSRKAKELVPAFVEAYEIPYPVCVDIDEQSEKAWHVLLWPHFSVIDHHGILRATGLATSRVDDVIEQILAEQRAGL